MDASTSGRREADADTTPTKKLMEPQIAERTWMPSDQALGKHRIRHSDETGKVRAPLVVDHPGRILAVGDTLLVDLVHDRPQPTVDFLP